MFINENIFENGASQNDVILSRPQCKIYVSISNVENKSTIRKYVPFQYLIMIRHFWLDSRFRRFHDFVCKQNVQELW